jgi:hypothetical protein
MVEHYSNRFPCRKTVSFLCQQGLNGKNGHSRLADIVNFCWNSASVTKKIKIPLAKNMYSGVCTIFDDVIEASRRNDVTDSKCL